MTAKKQGFESFEKREASQSQSYCNHLIHEAVFWERGRESIFAREFKDSVSEGAGASSQARLAPSGKKEKKRTTYPGEEELCPQLNRKDIGGLVERLQRPSSQSRRKGGRRICFTRKEKGRRILMQTKDPMSFRDGKSIRKRTPLFGKEGNPVQQREI